VTTNAVLGEMRRRLLVALGYDRPAMTPTERRVVELRRAWQCGKRGDDYRDFKALASACPHSQTVAYRNIAINGALAVYLRCRSCGANPLGVGVAIPHAVFRVCVVDPPALPEDVDRAAPEYEACVHCGERKRGEQHHFAPQGRFSDPNAWPVAYLCNECHRVWHDVMGWGNEPWARKEGER
jgi:hypothetical protein